MLRFGRRVKIKNKLLRHGKPIPSYQNTRCMSAGAGGGAGRPLLIGSGLILAGGAVTVGVVWGMPGVRKSIESSAPYTHYLFDPFLGPLTPIQTQTDPFESSLGRMTKSKPSVKAEKLKKESDMESSKLRTLSPEIPDTKPTEETSPSVNENDALLLSAINDKPDILETPPPPIEDVHEQRLDTEGPEPTVPRNSYDNEFPTEPDVAAVETQAAEVDAKDEEISEPQDEVPGLERAPDVVHDRILKLEEDSQAECAAISSILDDSVASAAHLCAKTQESNTEAAKAIELHSALLQEAMDETRVSNEDRRERWTSVSRVLEQKSRLQIEAETNYQQARRELKKLWSVIEQAKAMNKPEINRKIIESEQNHADMLKELDQAVREVNMKLYESHVMTQYRDLMDVSRDQFRNELLSAMQDAQGEQGAKLPANELNTLVSHAHRRVDQLQRELAEERVISAKKMEIAVRVAREQWEKQTEVDVEKKIEEITRQTEIEQDKKMEEAREAFEGEMRIQLKRQAAAHSEHLSDMLVAQEQNIKFHMQEEFEKTLKEQDRQFTEKMEEIKENYNNQMFELTERFQFDLNKALARVAGIEYAIDGRAHIENESRRAQEIWLGCEALRIALQYGSIGERVPLGTELQAIKQVEGVDKAMLEVLDSFPTQASDRGVFTEETLRASYRQVSKVCRRLSMVDETRNSLFTYILSYLKSFLIINRAQNEPPSDLDTGKLDTFNILSYATFCLENGDLEQAARFMNQLTGEPRRVADGWLKEARLYLETRQTVQALSALASAISIAANLEL